jgi:type II secretory pathway predicted ATPase ExeA
MGNIDLRSRFGLHTVPFTREIRVEHHQALPLYAETLDGLEGAVQKRMSAALVAPAGTGKTNLLRALCARLPEARYRCHYVKVSNLSKRDVCHEIALCMGLAPAGAYNSLLRRIQEKALTVADTDGLRPVLLLDDAHELRPDVLGMLAPLTNFDMDSRLVLSVILAGLSPLAALLRRTDMEGIARRFSHFAILRTLSRDETAAYVAHRMTVAGATCVPFDQGSLDALFEIGRGNLRATDQLALKSLELADQKGLATVDHVMVIEARRLLWP